MAHPAVQLELGQSAPDLTKSWADLEVPSIYQPIWEKLRRAAEREGFEPEELQGKGLSKLAKRCGWAPATVALYSKVARYCGLSVLRLEVTPEPAPDAALPLSRLWRAPVERMDILWARAALWAAMASQWPASSERFRNLTCDEVDVSGSALYIEGRRLNGIASHWQAWQSQRALVEGLSGSPYVLCSVSNGFLSGASGAAYLGRQLSPRGMQEAFRSHVRRVAALLSIEGSTTAEAMGALRYDTYRRLIIERGVEPVDRGKVRGARRQPSPT